jgi:phytoene dehydrogenase-like protein
MKYDIGIIGGGISGLSAGAFLAKLGMKVCIFEKNSNVGGYASCFKRNGITYDISLHSIGDLDKTGNLKNILETIDFFKYVEFSQALSNYTVVNKDKCVDYNGVSGFNKLLSETYPQNALEIQNIINTFIEISNAMISLADKNCADVRYFYSILSKYKNISLLDYLKKETSNNKIWNEFCRYWMYLGVYPDKLSLVFYAYIWTEYMVHGSYYPISKSKGISEAFSKIILENGGSISVNTEVKNIEHNHNYMVDVISQDIEEKIECSQIISAVSPKSKFFLDISENLKLSDKLTKKIQSQESSCSSFVIYLHLNKNFKDVYSEEGHEFFFDTDISSENKNSILENKIEKMPFSINVYENIVKNYQSDISEGSTISIFTMGDYDYWKFLEVDEYASKKEQWKSILIKRIEQTFPKFNEYIDDISISTPLTNERFTGNYKGAIYGMSQTVEASLGKDYHIKLPWRDFG